MFAPSLILMVFLWSASATDLKQQARDVLDSNWRGNWTIPAAGLYPHQWSWDSAFISMGLSTYNITRAQTEMNSLLFGAQWSNGMIPSIRFSPRYPASKYYFPGADWWLSHVSPYAPVANTTGILQPPVHAMACWQVYRASLDKSWLRRIYPRLMMWHRFLTRERSIDGLLYVRHPWESGTDNSPAFDESLRRLIDPSVPPYNRTDCDAPCPQRPTNWYYDRYVFLMLQARGLGYDESRIRRVSPVLVAGPMFNSLFVQSSALLQRMASVLGRSSDVPEIKGWIATVSMAMQARMWDDDNHVFKSIDLVTNRTIDSIGIPQLLGIGISNTSQRQRVFDRWVNSSVHFCSLGDQACRPVPSFDRQSAAFDPVRYWRGPVWVNTNWLMSASLGPALSRHILRQTRGLVASQGFREYFNALNGTGLGAHNFSWSASLFLVDP